jgi:hypothetical protein
MVYSNFNLDLIARRFKRSGSQPGIKTVNFPRKTDFSDIHVPPISWGTANIILPPIVLSSKFFKKVIRMIFPNEINVICLLLLEIWRFFALIYRCEQSSSTNVCPEGFVCLFYAGQSTRPFAAARF